MVAAAIVLWAAGGCQWFGNTQQECVAVVDGKKISLAEFSDRMGKKLALMENASSLNEKQLESLRKDILSDLIDERVMLNRADKLGVAVSDGELKNRIEEIRKDYSENEFDRLFAGRKDDYRLWKEELRKRLVLEKLIQQDVNARITVTDDEVVSYYRSHSKEGLSKERIHLSQIVLPDREKAEAVLQRLKNGEDFAAVAREVSTGPEAEKGGDMGVFSRGVLPETFDRVVFSVPPGRISRVVETPYGFHIFKVLEKERAGENVSAAEREKVRLKLRRDKEEQAYGKWLEQLRQAAVVKVNESVLSKLGDQGKQPVRPSSREQ